MTSVPSGTGRSRVVNTKTSAGANASDHFCGSSSAPISSTTHRYVVDPMTWTGAAGGASDAWSASSMGTAKSQDSEFC